MKVAEKFITEEDGAMLQKHVAEREKENSQRRVTAVKLQGSGDSSTETITTLQWSLNAGVQDCELLMEGNKSLLVEHNALHDCFADLKS
jgi:hypothetical protein